VSSSTGFPFNTASFCEGVTPFICTNPMSRYVNVTAGFLTRTHFLWVRTSVGCSLHPTDGQPAFSEVVEVLAVFRQCTPWPWLSLSWPFKWDFALLGACDRVPADWYFCTLLQSLVLFWVGHFVLLWSSTYTRGHCFYHGRGVVAQLAACSPATPAAWVEVPPGGLFFLLSCVPVSATSLLWSLLLSWLWRDGSGGSVLAC